MTDAESPFSAGQDIAGCTVISKNYLSHARILARSFKKHHPHAPFFVLLCDRNNACIDASKEPFEMIEVETIGIPEFRDMAFRYNVIELDTAVKPFFFRHLFDTHALKKLVFFDPDIQIYRPLSELSTLMDQHAVILTPHMTTPVDDGETPSERAILQAGINNLGFIAMRKSKTTDDLLAWWADRLYKYCYNRVADGLFVDQKWMDLASSYFGDVFQLREPGYNVAYWNLHERIIGGSKDNWTVNGEPLHFFHFSGFNPLLQGTVSRHQTRTHFANRPDIVPLFEGYRLLQIEAGYAQTRNLPYAYEWFDDGRKITDDLRIYYDRNIRKGHSIDPFAEKQTPLAETKSEKLPIMKRETFLERRHTWAPYQAAIRCIKHTVGQRLFYNLKQIIVRRPAVTMAMNASTPIIRERGVNVMGLLSREVGIGEAARGHVLALEAAHIPCSLHDIQMGKSRGLDTTFADRYHIKPDFDVSLIEVNADALPAFMELYGSTLKTNTYRIGHWAWELSDFPPALYNRFPLVHEVWVASSFVQKGLASCAPVPVLTMPYVVRDIPRGPHARAHFDIEEGVFVFLFMFDFFSVFKRKNPLASIEAFTKAFPHDPNVRLVLKYTNAAHFPIEAGLLQEAAKQDSRILLLDTYMNRQEVCDLLHCCDCYVSLHRSEGFGLTMAEAMRAGKPVIATDYSGNTDFMNETNSFPVRYTLTQVGEGAGAYPPSLVWAEPSTDYAAEQMKFIFTNSTSALSIAKKGKEYIEKNYAPDAIGALMRTRLIALEQHFGRA